MRPPENRPIRILFVFASLVAGGEETQVRLLARALDRRRYAIDVVACCRQPATPEEAHRQLEAIGVPVDSTPYHLSMDDTVAYLAGLIPSYDVVVSCQNVADVYPALERLHLRPPLIEYGGSVAEALAGPKHFTSRYVGLSHYIRDAAAGRMPGREHHALAIPPMVDPATFDPALRAKVRADHSVEAVIPQWTALFDTLAQRAPTPAPMLFRSFLQGGFECSSHRRARDRKRIDVIAATDHDRLAEEDYRILRRHGIATVRDGLRWHLIERHPGRYDWSSLDSQLSAARDTDTQVIWDLLHYGWPDDCDVWSPAFVTRFAAFAAAAARHIRQHGVGPCFYTPINEISFLSWGGGDVGYLNPFAQGRGYELKVQLARASIAAMDAIRAVDPGARFVHAEPVINIVADPSCPTDVPDAEGHRQAQFQAWDLIAGRLWPQIGGQPDLLDIVGVNFYHNNQWIHGGAQIGRTHPLYKPFHRILAETYARYGRPIFVAETGIEGEARAEWFAHIWEEVRLARSLGVPVEGVCLYPILDHPGWDDDRHCPNGLIGRDRGVHHPLATALAAARAGESASRP